MNGQLEEFIEEYSFGYYGIPTAKCIWEKDLREFFKDKVIFTIDYDEKNIDKIEFKPAEMEDFAKYLTKRLLCRKQKSEFLARELEMFRLDNEVAQSREEEKQKALKGN